MPGLVIAPSDHGRLDGAVVDRPPQFDQIYAETGWNEVSSLILVFGHNGEGFERRIVPVWDIFPVQQV